MRFYDLEYLQKFGFINIHSMNMISIDQSEIKKLTADSTIVKLYQNSIVSFLQQKNKIIPINSEWVFYSFKDEFDFTFVVIGLFERPEYSFEASCQISNDRNEVVATNQYLKNVNGDWFDFNNQELSNDLTIDQYSIVS